jgi:hypothetical protein
MGTINMLGLAKRVKARILLASTSEIYGDPTVHPQPESYWGNVNTIGIRVSLRFHHTLVVLVDFAMSLNTVASHNICSLIGMLR